MQTVTSHDGTTIAYDSYGSGPALILVGGALSFRKFKKMEQISEALSGQLTVINYDRRGRGDSSPAGAVSVEREIEDIAALIQAAGGRASPWGWSSGGATGNPRGERRHRSRQADGLRGAVHGRHERQA